MKNKETLEEAGLKHCELIDNFPALENPLFSFKEGAKWQKERMYSEEEVKEIINLSCEEGMFIQRTINDKVRIPYLRIRDFTVKMFEQFKKK